MVPPLGINDRDTQYHLRGRNSHHIGYAQHLTDPVFSDLAQIGERAFGDNGRKRGLKRRRLN